MRTIEVDLYTPKEIYKMIKRDVKISSGLYYGWWKSRKIRKVYGITRKSIWTKLKTIEEKDRADFIACFPSYLQDSVYAAVYQRKKASAPKGDFR